MNHFYNQVTFFSNKPFLQPCCQISGPSTWPSLYPVCAESRQSPIAIVAANTVLNTSLGRFNREDFDSIPDSMLIRNNGHGGKSKHYFLNVDINCYKAVL